MMNEEHTLEVSNKQVFNSDSYGDEVTIALNEGGIYLAINLYDGHTLLNKEEAKFLGELLVEYSQRVV